MPKLFLSALWLLLCVGCSTTTKFPNEQISASQFTFAHKTQEYDTPPVLLSGRMPEYPLVARIRHEFGLVVARFVIDLDGRTKEIRFEGKPPPALATSLALAVQGWRFQPALKNGKAVSAHVRFSLDFGLPLRERNLAPAQHFR